MSGALGVLLLVASTAASVERSITVAGPGRVAVALDRDVYDEARPDLGDLRVLDGAGRSAPFVLDRGGHDDAVRAAPRVLDRGFTRGRLETVTLDFGRRVWKHEIGFRLSGDNFRRRVIVEGSDDAAQWTTLNDSAYVFAIPGPPPVRYETVAIPDNEQRYLRVTVMHGEGDPERIEVEGPWASSAERRRGPARDFVARGLREEDALRHETLLTLDLGARHQPFRALALAVDDPRFLRSVAVEARRDPPKPRPGEEPGTPYWIALGEGCIYRYDDGGRRLESLRLEVAGRESTLRLRVRNADDRPLSLGPVTIEAPVERVLFEAAPGESYRLTYGAPGLGPPSYDLARTVGDLDAWAAASTPASLAVPKRVVAEARPPWTEVHPELLWAGLVAAVAALGALTWRALRPSRS